MNFRIIFTSFLVVYLISISFSQEQIIYSEEISERQALIEFYNSTNGNKWNNNTHWLGEPGSECTWYGVICNDSKQVEALHLFSNNLTGKLPSSIKYLNNLKSLILHNNKLSDPIPTEIFELNYLESITLNNNNYSSNIVSIINNNIFKKWDIKNDNRIGIEEAINALKISAGMNVSYANELYDFNDYFGVNEQRYLYSEEIYRDSKIVQGTAFVEITNEMVENKEVRVTTYISGQWSGWKDYELVTDLDIFYLGWGFENNSWYEPPIKFASRSMYIGEHFYNFIKIEGSHYYVEYIFAGIEDIVVPAGIFEKCLKIIKKQNTGLRQVYYYARNIGLVKATSSSSGDGYNQELVYTSINNISYPPSRKVYMAKGQWKSESNQSGGFTFCFSSQNDSDKIFTTINFENYQTQNDLNYEYYLISEDNKSFKINTEFYDSNAPEFDISINDFGDITGSCAIENINYTISGKVTIYDK